jgi:hypothetical protein
MSFKYFCTVITIYNNITTNNDIGYKSPYCMYLVSNRWQTITLKLKTLKIFLYIFRDQLIKKNNSFVYLYKPQLCEILKSKSSVHIRSVI